MSREAGPPIDVTVHGDVEYRADRPLPYRARVRWTDPSTRKRPSRSEAFDNEDAAKAWIDQMQRLAQAGVRPETATMTLAEYGESVMTLAIRGLEPKSLDPYLAGWRRRVLPTLGHVTPRMITNGSVDRAVNGWIAEGCSHSTIKNSLAILVRIMEQAVRDGVIDRNPARVTGWQHTFRKAEDELDDPRLLALPDWATLSRLADALVARSSGQYRGWGDLVLFAASTAARIGEVAGCRVSDIDIGTWLWTVRRQTTPSPGVWPTRGPRASAPASSPS